MTRPFDKTPTTIPEMLSARQAALNVSDEDLAVALGYDDAVVIRMLKSGRMRLPLNKVRVFSEALEVPSRAVLQAVDPHIAEIFEDCISPESMSPAEARLISALRRASQGRKISPIMFEKDAIIALVVA